MAGSVLALAALVAGCAGKTESSPQGDGDWRSIGQTKAEICERFSEVVARENAALRKVDAASGQRSEDVRYSDNPANPGGDVYAEYAALDSGKLASYQQYPFRGAAYFALSSRPDRGARPEEYFLLLSALPAGAVLKSHEGEAVAYRIDRSDTVGLYLPAACRLQKRCASKVVSVDSANCKADW